jgi:hypothetical protein
MSYEKGNSYYDSRDLTTHVPDHHIIWAVSAISIVIAAILLVGAIICLFYVTNPVAKLCLVAAFTFVFALSVCLLTRAKISEMFAATAAYAAVLVVFISGNISGSNLAPIVMLVPANLTSTATSWPSPI